MSSWKNIPVKFTIELCRDQGEILDLTYEKVLPADVLAEVNRIAAPSEDSLELDFDVKSSGYHKPMSMYGGHDHLGWPEEGDDERVLENVNLLLNGKKIGRLNKAAVATLDGMYREEIDTAELEVDDGGPECDPPDID